MTVEVYDGPGTEARRSDKYAVTVGGQSVYVYKNSRTSTIDTTLWSIGNTISCHTVIFGTDSSVTVTIKQLSGNISSAIIGPTRKTFTYSIVGDTMTIVLRPRDQVKIMFDGSGLDHLIIRAMKLKRPIPTGYVTYDPDIHTDVPTNTCLYFPPGEYTVGSLEFHTGGKIYVDGGAYLIGRCKFRGNQYCHIMGPGIISGEDVTWETVHALGDWFQQVLYAAVYGDPNFAQTRSTIQDTTFVQSPFYNIAYAGELVEDIAVIDPWNPNCDGINASNKPVNSKHCIIRHNLTFVCDDNLYVATYQNNLSIYGNVCFHHAAGIMVWGYWPWPRSGYRLHCWDNYADSYAKNDLNHVSDCLFKNLMDGEVNESGYGPVNGLVEGWKIGGNFENPVFVIGNLKYEWGTQALGYGNTYEITFRNIDVENGYVANLYKSSILGTNKQNRAHDIRIVNYTYNGVRVTNSNKSTYFTISPYCDNILIGNEKSK